MAKKKLRKIRFRKRTAVSDTNTSNSTTGAQTGQSHDNKEHKSKILSFFDKNYKALLIIPFLLLVLALGQIIYQTITTGYFMHRGISLKGGTIITVPITSAIDVNDFRAFLEKDFAGHEISTKTITNAGILSSIIVETDITDSEDINKLTADIEEYTKTDKAKYGVEITGPSLGSSFFKQLSLAIVFAFLFMGVVVLLYFRTVVPSSAVILAAFSDIAVTLAVVNVLGIKLSSAGIAGFLMLIGYSIDTDILLSTNVLKRKDDTIFNRTLRAAKTGLTMSITTITAVTLGLIFSKSEVLSQIMTIVLIGLLVDLINTWIQNVGILRWYVEKKEKQKE